MAGRSQQHASGPVRVAVVAPTYNHAAPLAGVLLRLGPLGLTTIVVDDGSRDETARVLREWAGAGRVVVTHDLNRGKAAALRTGFREAAARGFTHAATIDTDGQHEPEDLRRLLAVAGSNPGALVIGGRPRRIEGYPITGRLGRALSNAMVRLESGVRVSDTQSGMRVYPLEAIETLGARASRYAFETEVLARAGWAGVPVIEAPISCVYKVAGGRTTHFRLGRDTLGAIRMHAGLLARSCLPGRPVPRLGDGDESASGTIFQRACRWLSPRRMVAMATGGAAERRRLAASVALGLLMATLPVYGVKTVACLWLSARLRLHPLAVIGVSSLSTPPLGLVFAAASVFVGTLVLHGAAPAEGPALWGGEALAWLGGFALEWAVGSVVLGCALAAAGYWLVRLALGPGPARGEGTAAAPEESQAA